MKKDSTISEDLITFFSGGRNHKSIDEWIEKTDFELNSYKHELFKFEQTYLKTLRAILDDSKTKKVERWISETHEMGKLFNSNKNSKANQKALEFIKNNYNNEFYITYTLGSYTLVTEDDGDKQALGRQFAQMEAVISRDRKLNSQREYIGDVKNFLDVVQGLKNKAKIISEKPTRYRFAKYFLPCIEGIYKDLKELVDNYNINIDRKEILNTNRPFLDELNTINLTEFAIQDFKKYKELVKKYNSKIPRLRIFDKTAKKLFPDSKVVMHSNVVSGLASPYDVMKKLIVDLILVLDIVFVKSSLKADDIQEFIEDQYFSELTTNLITIYIRIGYPLPINLKKDMKDRKLNFENRTANKSVIAIIKQTAPFIIGKEFEHPDVEEGLKIPNILKQKDNPTNHYFTVN